MSDSNETRNATDQERVGRREALKTVVRNSAYAAPIATVLLTKTKGAMAGDEGTGGDDGGGGGGGED